MMLFLILDGFRNWLCEFGRVHDFAILLNDDSNGINQFQHSLSDIGLSTSDVCEVWAYSNSMR